MKRLLITTLLALAVACSKQTPSTAREKTYPMTATIVSRDPAKNTLNLDNKEVFRGEDRFYSTSVFPRR
jgi:hypothetical protein